MIAEIAEPPSPTIVAVPQAQHSGTYVAPAARVPMNVTGKVQLHIPVAALDGVNPLNTMSATVEISRDNGQTWLPLARFTWQGNTKAVRAGWPSGGPAIRVPDDLRDALVRTTITSGSLTYGVEVTEV